MKMRSQFLTSLILAGLGVILLGVDKMTASADTMFSYGQSFTLVTIIALAFLIIAAVWFYILSIRR